MTSPTPPVSTETMNSDEAKVGLDDKLLIRAWEVWQQNEERRTRSREMAVTRLKYCLAHRCCSLDLSGLGLSELPPCFPDFIETLNLRNNNLRRLPGQLPSSLVMLNASKNMLTQLPDDLPDSIEILRVTSNNLMCLPARLPASLLELYVSYNNLTNLLASLPGSLKILNVEGNSLTKLPMRLPVLLKILYASSNLLTQLPDNLPENIKECTLTNNYLVRLPARLPAALVELHASHNSLKTLPARLPASIKLLDVSHNQLTVLPRNLPSGLSKLYVKGNQLTRLPTALPPFLTILDASYNQLTTLPKNLPAALCVRSNLLAHLPAVLPAFMRLLDISDNRLTALPENLPDGIEELIVMGNDLRHLPRRLPAGLIGLYANYNELTSLPARLPVSMEILDVSCNQLATLPENLPETLLRLRVNNNRLTDLSTLLPALLRELNIDNNPLLPSLLSIGINRYLNFLNKLRRWHSKIDINQWRQIYSEDNAGTFGHFLQTLRQGKNQDSQALKNHIVNWLDYLARDDHQEIRRQTFALAQEGANSCVDRASFYFTAMYILMVEETLISSNAPLSRVVENLLGLFRLQVLEQIAAKKVAERRRASPEFAEDLEIYLAYQCLLQQRLALPVCTELQFTDIASVSRDDLELACKVIAEKEKTDFLRYWFTESALWTAMLEKWDAKKKAAKEADYLDAISAVSFKQAVAQVLAENQLSLDDVDAERAIRCQLAAALFYQYREALSREYLASQQALSLLERFSSSPTIGAQVL